MKKVILISGKAQSGKDSFAAILKNKLEEKGYGNSLIIHNADSLKFYLRQYKGWNGEKTEESRTAMQQLGTERTKIALNKPFFWIEKTCDIVDIFKDEFDYFLVPDTRFLSEIFYTKGKFTDRVITVRVSRKNFENNLTEEQRKHVSEIELDNFIHDYYIDTNNLDELEEEVDIFIDKYNYYIK